MMLLYPLGSIPVILFIAFLPCFTIYHDTMYISVFKLTSEVNQIAGADWYVSVYSTLVVIVPFS